MSVYGVLLCSLSSVVYSNGNYPAAIALARPVLPTLSASWVTSQAHQYPPGDITDHLRDALKHAVHVEQDYPSDPSNVTLTARIE